MLTAPRAILGQEKNPVLRLAERRASLLGFLNPAHHHPPGIFPLDPSLQ
jgi:hypothetical protein